jgi:hypothetical protein
VFDTHFNAFSAVDKEFVSISQRTNPGFTFAIQ